MTPMEQPFNVLKTPFRAQLRVWIRADGEEALRSYLLRRYKSGELYWSPLTFVPAGGALCLRCFGPVQVDGHGGWLPCERCEGPTQTMAVPM